MQSKDLDKARLGDKITWSVFGEKRGSSEEEVIGADLADELNAKYKPGVGEEGANGYEEEEEDEDDEENEENEENEEDEELTHLTNNSIECGGQVFMIDQEETW